jgi:hypothetical protein
MKVGHDGGCGVMNDEIFGGEAFGEVQNSGLGGIDIQRRFEPNSSTLRICP